MDKITGIRTDPDLRYTYAPGSTITIGRKDDQNKDRLELVPPSLILAVGTILTFGATKYGARNWEKGISWGRVFGALMRHLWWWWGGEGQDAETGKSHLWHAACCIAFLIEYETTNLELDDRPQRSTIANATSPQP